jgi:hypothetical protein
LNEIAIALLQCPLRVNRVGSRMPLACLQYPRRRRHDGQQDPERAFEDHPSIPDQDVTIEPASGKLSEFDGRIRFAPAIRTDFTPGPDLAV